MFELDVAEGLKDVVTKSGLADMMNSFVSDNDEKWLMFNAKFSSADEVHGRELYMKKKMILSVCIIFLTACIFYTIYNLDKCRAVMTGEELSFDGNTYHWVNYEKIGAYTETHHMICRTDFFGGYIVYEIREYPDYKYVVVRSMWEAEVYEKN